MIFNPNRLAIARKRRQMTKKSLAEASGLSQLTLTRLESGTTSDPSDETISAVAKALRYPADFFYRDECEVVSEDSVSFRSLSSLTARQRDAATSASTLAVDIDNWVSRKFDLPRPDLPDLKFESPQAAAAALRSYWGIGFRPIPNMIKLLEAKGVRVFGLCEGNKSVDAFSYWRGSTPYVFLNNFKSAERSRFDAAHELGHLVMHKNTKGTDCEREADEFAAAFLMPREDLISHLPKFPSLARIIEMKSRWGVSTAALARNAFEVGLLSEWSYREICRQISMSGYRSREPRPMPREGSTVWKAVFEALWKERFSKDRVARELGIPIDELEALVTGMPDDPAPASSPRQPLRSV